MDENNNIYLFTEKAIIMHNEQVHERMRTYQNPYDYYYDYGLITDDTGYIPPILAKDRFYKGIVKFYVGRHEYTLRYQTTFDDDIVNYRNKNSEIYTIDVMSKKVTYTKDEYYELVRNFGIRQSFYPLTINTVYADQ